MTRCTVIAEAGVNHNGNIDLAVQLVDAAAVSGADIVKFQTFKAEKLASRSAEKAEYQKQFTAAAESQFDMLRRLELTVEMHQTLIRRCKEKNILFLSTAFDESSLDDLLELGIDRIKLPSGEITNGPLLLHAARAQKPLIVSTGMSDLAEVGSALKIICWGLTGHPEAPTAARCDDAFGDPDIRRQLAERVTLLHCTTEYPAPVDDVNLRAMDTMQDAFGLRVGLSDHTQGIVLPIAAVARGAVVIEKHFTLDRGMDGPDHAASLEVGELAEMVAGIRLVEAALGDGKKRPAPSEIKNIEIARKSLVASRPIRAGETLSSDNMTAKRPAIGRSPMDFWALSGTVAQQDYAPDELIK